MSDEWELTMARIVAGKKYKIPNAGAFLRRGESPEDGWECVDGEGKIIARFPTGALCRGYLNRLREAHEAGGAAGRRRAERLINLGARTVKGQRLDAKELEPFEGANKREASVSQKTRALAPAAEES